MQPTHCPLFVDSNQRQPQSHSPPPSPPSPSLSLSPALANNTHRQLAPRGVASVTTHTAMTDISLTQYYSFPPSSAPNPKTSPDVHPTTARRRIFSFRIR
uniref:Uncharacterized protein n=1 Tax=Physcomitrium patens TaxID=3218 RepID=A0A2K1J1P7_PHYPA|nr:hypothetical protein PHYPA_023346 [Physcomitrium patens]